MKKFLISLSALLATMAFAGEPVTPGSTSETNVSPVQAQILGNHLNGIQVKEDPNHPVPVLEGQPLTAVVVTQCNLVVAVYFTMSDGKLVRFGKENGMKAEELVSMAYNSAKYSERVEVQCNGLGEGAHENHSRNDT